MSRHEIKRNDTRPYWPITLTFEDGSVPDLSGGTVRFLAREAGNGQVKVDDTAVITDGPNGQAEWRPSAGDTDQAGSFDVEWEVTFSDGTVQTFPTRGYDRLIVVGDLA